MNEKYKSVINWGKLISIYYDHKSYVEETEEQKAVRLAKEKAEKRNSKIEEILNDKN